ncbi:hypothetical protein DL96DRAFT_902120 [Flagelloscypha sp. PMI_526]|nr:hypothetical protein DL96DRAFT_902120 [Flagelloscypha sp. PMI_526]
MSPLCSSCNLPHPSHVLENDPPHSSSCGLCFFMFGSKPAVPRVCQCKRTSTSSPNSSRSTSSVAPLLSKSHRRVASHESPSVRPPSPPPLTAMAALVPFPPPAHLSPPVEMSERKSEETPSSPIHISRPRRLASSTTAAPPSSLARHLASLNAQQRQRPSTASGRVQNQRGPPPAAWNHSASRLKMNNNPSSESLRSRAAKKETDIYKNIDFDESVLSLARRQSQSWVHVDSNDAVKTPHYRKASALPYVGSDDEDGDTLHRSGSGGGGGDGSRPTSMMSLGINVVDTPDGRKLRKAGSFLSGGGSVRGRSESLSERPGFGNGRKED